MTENGSGWDTTSQEKERQGARRRFPDPVALVVGLLALGMAVSAFVGQLPLLPHVDPRWLFAAVAAVVGLLLLVGSLRGRRGS